MCTQDDLYNLIGVGLMATGAVTGLYGLWTWFGLSYYATAVAVWLTSWLLVWEFMVWFTRAFAAAAGLAFAVKLFGLSGYIHVIIQANRTIQKTTNNVIHCNHPPDGTDEDAIPPAA